MRAIGFALVLIGIVAIYLSVKGKLGAAFSALLTGNVPDTSSGSNNSNNPVYQDPLSRGNLPAGTPNYT